MNQQENNIQPTKQGIPVMLVAQPIAEDEVNLSDLWCKLLKLCCILAKRKVLIAAITTVATILGLLYSLTLTPTYETKISLLPPTLEGIQELQLAGLPYTPNSVFALFTKQLNSTSVRRDFFLHHGVVDKLAPQAQSEQERERAFQDFGKSLAFTDGILSIKGTDATTIANWANDFVQLAAKKTREAFITDYNISHNVKKADLERQINTKLRMAPQQRKDRIAELQEAYGIAKNLGITDYQLPQFKTKGASANVNVSELKLPLFMHGSKALKAELDELKVRKDDKPFIPGLLALQDQLVRLEMTKINPDNIQFMRVDMPAIAPTHPIKRYLRLRIVLASFLVGIVIGILAAFIAAASSLARNREIIT